MTVGERIRIRRKELNLTQEELGKKINVTRSAICKTETDKDQNITLDRVSIFAKALECTEADLMGWSEIKVPNGEIDIAENTITIKFWSDDDKDYYLKMSKLVSDPTKRKIISKFIDSLLDD